MVALSVAHCFTPNAGSRKLFGLCVGAEIVACSSVARS